jgi:hypothetical protein
VYPAERIKSREVQLGPPEVPPATVRDGYLKETFSLEDGPNLLALGRDLPLWESDLNQARDV